MRRVAEVTLSYSFFPTRATAKSTGGASSSEKPKS
jgi:hypothetical protein